MSSSLSGELSVYKTVILFSIAGFMGNCGFNIGAGKMDEVEILDQVATNWKSGEWKRSVDNFYKDDPQLKASLAKFGMSGDTSHCVQLLNSFIHHGPNGKHFVMVFEILGVNFLEIIKRYDYKGVPLPLVRKLTRQCLIGLDYMHRMCKIIHTDFKPENVVICLRDDEVLEIAKTG